METIQIIISHNIAQTALHAVIFIVLSMFMAGLTLFPINDQPVGIFQVVCFLIGEIILFSFVFGFVQIKFG